MALRLPWHLVVSGFMALVGVLLFLESGNARRTHVDQAMRAKLEAVQTVYLFVLALTEQGQVPSEALTRIVGARFEAVGLDIVTDPTAQHDVDFRVKCEESKTWEGTTHDGGDAELLFAPARLWKGPACRLTYRFSGQDLGWSTEVRTPFEDAQEAARKVGRADPGVYALEQLGQELGHSNFPILVLAEWGQPHRLLTLLTSPDTSPQDKRLILDLFSHTPLPEAIPHLQSMVTQGIFPVEATIALSGNGTMAVPFLIRLFTAPDTPSTLRAAAAKGLGRIGMATGASTALSPLLDYLSTSLERDQTSAEIDFPVLTEVVWAIGQFTSDRSYELIKTLHNKIWTMHDPSREMAKLREVTDVVLTYVDLSARIL